jgi:hypothetical protein
MSEELKKEWEIEFDATFEHTEVLIGRNYYSTDGKELKSFISSLLAKQQEEFVKIIKEIEDGYSSEYGDGSKISIADIKNKLKI